jgi:hypothetical protein
MLFSFRIEVLNIPKRRTVFAVEIGHTSLIFC